MGRLEARSEIDLTIIDKSPITLRVEFNGWNQLEYGYEVHADSWYQNVQMKDTTAWVQFGQHSTYQFYKMQKYISVRLNSPDADNLYLEWMTLSER